MFGVLILFVGFLRLSRMISDRVIVMIDRIFGKVDG